VEGGQSGNRFLGRGRLGRREQPAHDSFISRATLVEVPLTGLSRKSTRPGANGVVDLSPFEFLDRLADLVPPPRKHRHRYHGVFAPNHKLRRAVTSLAIGNVGKRQEAVTGGRAAGGRATGGCCDANPNQKPRSHDTSRIAWAKLMARVGEEFPLACPTCGGDIRLIAFITEPEPIRKILTHLGEPLEVCRMVPKKVAYTVTRCVPRVVYREVGCCGDVVEAAPEVATEEDAGEAAAE
jgi:hypothetical protein